MEVIVQEESNLKIKAKNFFTVLRDNSVFKDDPIPEWEVKNKIEAFEGKEVSYCICSTPIIHEFKIRNKINGNELKIGSECVKRWGFKVVCKSCKSSLGNIVKRLVKEDFLCPACKKEEKQRIQAEQQRQESRRNTLGSMRLFWYGKYYMKKFSEIIDDTDYVNKLINVTEKPQTLQLFEEYVNLYYEVQVETHDMLVS